MLSRLEVIAFAGFLMLANVSRAEEQIVIVMNDTFFPTVSYVEVGDTVRFVNTASDTQTIVANDDRWSIGPLNTGDEAVLAVVEGMSQQFKIAANTEVDGRLSFEPTPMD